MNVPNDPKTSEANPTKWNYVEIEVRDGKRSLYPTHVSFDKLIFKEPPILLCQQVEIVITNNGRAHKSHALVLAHDPASTRIPIQQIDFEQSEPAKLTA